MKGSQLLKLNLIEKCTGVSTPSSPPIVMGPLKCFLFHIPILGKRLHLHSNSNRFTVSVNLPVLNTPTAAAPPVWSLQKDCQNFEKALRIRTDG